MEFTSTGARNATKIRSEFPKGTKVVLESMNDPYITMPAGMKGTVTEVDDAGQIHVRWENGSGLALIPGEDAFHKEDEA